MAKREIAKKDMAMKKFLAYQKDCESKIGTKKTGKYTCPNLVGPNECNKNSCPMFKEY